MGTLEVSGGRGGGRSRPMIRRPRILSGDAPASMADRLAALLAQESVDLTDGPDRYGDGLVPVLEGRIAELLGLPAAVWFPSGTMAQQAVLRTWAERAGTRRVAVHPLQHTQQHEEDGFGALTGLVAVHPTVEPRHPTPADLATVPGPLAAAVVELPMQELGYVLPAWQEYADFCAAAHARGVPVHVDGARLWESRSHLGHGPAEVAALADSVYVSCYKGLGALSGAVVAVPAGLEEDVRRWRVRYGGNLPQQFPAVAGALHGLETRLDRMAAWVDHARIVAAAIDRLPGLRVTPSPPHINEFFVRAALPADVLRAAADAEEAASGERWVRAWWTAADGSTLGEVVVHDPGLDWSAEDVERVGRRVLERAAP